MPKTKKGKSKKKSMAWKVEDPDPVSDEPYAVESAVTEDGEIAPEPAPPEELCEATDSVEDWERPLEPAPEEPCEATESIVTREREICPLAVEETTDPDSSSESACEVVEHTIIEKSNNDANIPATRSPGNREYGPSQEQVIHIIQPFNLAIGLIHVQPI
jgi:hypothetical protein